MTNIIKKFVAGEVNIASKLNNWFNARVGHLLPFGLDGATNDGQQDVGSSQRRWRDGYFSNSLQVGNSVITEDSISGNATNSYAINSVAVLSEDSNLPHVIRTNGTDEISLFASADEPLSLVIKGEVVTRESSFLVDSNEIVSIGATGAVAQVKRFYYEGQQESRWIGQEDSLIRLHNEGSLWSSLNHGDAIAFSIGDELSIGRYFKMKHPNFDDNNLYITGITNAKRGYFIKADSITPATVGLNEDDNITRLNLGWLLFDQSQGVAVVTYSEPTRSSTAPTNPASRDYWFDIPNDTWRRYSGTSWIEENKILLGEIAVDASGNCIGTRTYDLSKNYLRDETIKNAIVELSDTKYTLKCKPHNIYVYGTAYLFSDASHDVNLVFDGNNSKQLTGGLQADTLYYAYIKNTGALCIETAPPHERSDLKGYYHPYATWRCVGAFYTDANAEILEEPYFFKRDSELLLKFNQDDFVLSSSTMLLMPFYGHKKSIVITMKCDRASFQCIGVDSLLDISQTNYSSNSSELRYGASHPSGSSGTGVIGVIFLDQDGYIQKKDNFSIVDFLPNPVGSFRAEVNTTYLTNNGSITNSTYGVLAVTFNQSFFLEPLVLSSSGTKEVKIIVHSSLGI